MKPGDKNDDDNDYENTENKRQRRREWVMFNEKLELRIISH